MRDKTPDEPDMIERRRHFGWRTFGVSLFLVICALWALWAWIPPAYDTNDDAKIRAALEGTLIPGQPPTGFALLPHAALGWLLVGVRQVWPGAYSWDIAVAGTLALGVAIFVSLLWGAFGGGITARLLAIATAVLVLLPLASSVQYTISATTAGGAAVALAWHELKGSRARRSVLALAVATLVTALLLRSGAAMAGAAAVIVSLLPRAIQTRRRGVTVLGVLGGAAVALFMALQALDVALYESRPEWDAYRRLNQVVTALFDWNWQAVPAVDVTGARKSVGWTSNDWAMLEHYWAVNPERFGLERVQNYYDATAGQVTIRDRLGLAAERFQAFDRQNLRERMGETWPLLLALLVIVAARARRPDIAATIGAALLFVVFCLLTQVAFKSLPFRLFAPLVACFAGVVLSTTVAGTMNRRSAAAALAAVLVLTGYQTTTVLAAMAANRHHSLQVDAEVAALAKLGASLVVIHADAFPDEHWRRPFHSPTARLLTIRLDPNNQNPQLQTFLRTTGRALPAALCDDPSLLVVSEPGRLEVVTEDLQQRAGRAVGWELAYAASFRAWRCVPAE